MFGWDCNCASVSVSNVSPVVNIESTVHKPASPFQIGSIKTTCPLPFFYRGKQRPVRMLVVSVNYHVSKRHYYDTSIAWHFYSFFVFYTRTLHKANSERNTRIPGFVQQNNEGRDTRTFIFPHLHKCTFQEHFKIKLYYNAKHIPTAVSALYSKKPLNLYCTCSCFDNYMSLPFTFSYLHTVLYCMQAILKYLRLEAVFCLF